MNKKKILGAITVISAILGLATGGIEAYGMYQTILQNEQAEKRAQERHVAEEKRDQEIQKRAQERHEAEEKEKAIILGEMESENLNKRIIYAQGAFDSCFWFLEDEENNIGNMLDIAERELNINGDLEKAESILNEVANKIISCDKFDWTLVTHESEKEVMEETMEEEGGNGFPLVGLPFMFVIPLIIAGISGVLWKKQDKLDT